MSDFDLDWNGDEIVEALSEPFHQANEVLGREFAKEITANKWDWPSAPTPRDIVDTGELRRSYAGERASETEHDHSWNVDYAMAVHEGAVFKGGHTLPGRPWVRVTLREVDVADIYARLARALLGQIKDPP